MRQIITYRRSLFDDERTKELSLHYTAEAEAKDTDDDDEEEVLREEGRAPNALQRTGRY